MPIDAFGRHRFSDCWLVSNIFLRDAGAAADRADIGVQVVESRVSAGGPARAHARVSLDDARAAVGDDAQLASALRVLADAAKRLAARLERG